MTMSPEEIRAALDSMSSEDLIKEVRARGYKVNPGIAEFEDCEIESEYLARELGDSEGFPRLAREMKYRFRLRQDDLAIEIAREISEETEESNGGMWP